jgi:hypothetical protein
VNPQVVFGMSSSYNAFFQTWGSVIEIRDAYKLNGGQTPFGCADNSNSVKNE